MCQSHASSTFSLAHVFRKILWLLLSIVICVSFIHSARTTQDNVIAITQIVEHPSLEQARLGALEALAAQGFYEGKNLHILYQNAYGSIATAHQIIQNFIAQAPQVILAISTPSAQVALKASRNAGIPVVFTSVTDPVSAGLIMTDQPSSGSITGSIDTPPVAELITMMKQFLPHLQTVGIVYSAAEPNSVWSVRLFKEVANQQNIVVEEATVLNSGQVGAAVTSLLDKVDAFYLPSDNTVFSALDIVIRLTKDHKKAVFSNDPGSVHQGVLACIGYDQRAVGYAAGQLIAAILKGSDATSLPVKTPERPTVIINDDSLCVLGLTIPPPYASAEIFKAGLQKKL